MSAATLGRTTDPHKRFEQYENAEMIAWLLDPERIRYMLGQFSSGGWRWDSFVKEQEDLRQRYKERAQIAPFTRSLTYSKEKNFMHTHRVPVKVDEILLKLDPELDGRNDKKLNKFLSDFPVFDLRMRASK